MRRAGSHLRAVRGSQRKTRASSPQPATPFILTDNDNDDDDSGDGLSLNHHPLLKVMASSSATANAISSGDLIDLASSSTSATVHPSDDSILSVLNTRFHSDLPYTRIGTTNLVVVNPYKTLANVNDVSAKEYEDRSYKDTSLPLPGQSPSLPPHLYDLAARVYLMMRRRNESQSILFRCVSLQSC